MVATLLEDLSWLAVYPSTVSALPPFAGNDSGLLRINESEFSSSINQLERTLPVSVIAFRHNTVLSCCSYIARSFTIPSSYISIRNESIRRGCDNH